MNARDKPFYGMRQGVLLLIVHNRATGQRPGFTMRRPFASSGRKDDQGATGVQRNPDVRLC